MSYKSSSRLPYSARLQMIVFIKDGNGNSSFQIGSDDGIPTVNGQSMYDSALLYAFYKHFSMAGIPIVSKDYEKNILEFVEDYEVKQVWYEYRDEARTYSFKTENIKGKRYSVVRRKGKIDYQQPVRYTTPSRAKSSFDPDFRDFTRRGKVFK